VVEKRALGFCFSVGASLLAMAAYEPTDLCLNALIQLWERACSRRRPDSRPNLKTEYTQSLVGTAEGCDLLICFGFGFGFGS